MSTILIIMHSNRIEWLVRDDLSTYASGTDLLNGPFGGTNGDYDSLLSNVVNHCHQLCKDKSDIDFIFRKA